jgi:hypothetical protein
VVVLLPCNFVGEDSFDGAYVQNKTVLLHLDQAASFSVVLDLVLLVSLTLCGLLLVCSCFVKLESQLRMCEL